MSEKHGLCIAQVLNSDFSAQAAAQCMNRLAKLSARFIGDRGFSIGIDDVMPAPALQKAKEHLMVDGCALVGPNHRTAPCTPDVASSCRSFASPQLQRSVLAVAILASSTCQVCC